MNNTKLKVKGEVEVIVERPESLCDNGKLCAYITGTPVKAKSKDLRGIFKNMKRAVDLYLKDNSNPCKVLSGEFKLVYKVDVTTFLDYYGEDLFSSDELKHITGFDDTQVFLYTMGDEDLKPSKSQVERIKKGINTLIEELSAIRLQQCHSIIKKQ